MDYNNLSSYPFNPSSACGAEEGPKGFSLKNFSFFLTSLFLYPNLFPINRAFCFWHFIILEKGDLYILQVAHCIQMCNPEPYAGVSLFFAAGLGFANEVQPAEVIKRGGSDAGIMSGALAQVPFM